jgi:double-stranded uracil-DNA glycosylase
MPRAQRIVKACSSTIGRLVLDLEAARNRTIPDVLPAPGDRFDVLFCGINPGLYSAATGFHFARPGNRFWPALHMSGFTPRRLDPSEQWLMPGYGLGITNIAARATARAAELTDAELRDGAEHLTALVAKHHPAVVAILGVTAYRPAFARPRAVVGPQPEPLAGSRLHVLPNPSGLNAHWSQQGLADAFASLRATLPPAVDAAARPPLPRPPHRRCPPAAPPRG